MTLAARHGELAGHLHGYTAELIVRGVMQTAADRRLTYCAIPDEVAVVGDAVAPTTALLELGRCLVPWRDELRQFTYYCLLDAGHDDEELIPLTDQPEHGWYRLLDAYERGAQVMQDAADRIEARRQAALEALRHGA